MKKTFLVLTTFLFFSTLFVSCEDDFNVNAEWKDITVVVGLLSQNDTMHYIKINKAFLGPGNALEFAQIADSSNYPNNLEVVVEERNGNNLLRTLVFDTTTIFNKEPGLFYYPKQVLYRTYAALNQEYSYKLIVRNKSTGKEITAVTPLVKSFSIEKPQAFDRAAFDGENPKKTEWISAVNGRRYELVIRFHFTEMLAADTSQKTEKYIDMNVFSGIRSPDSDGGVPMEYVYYGSPFFHALNTKVTVDPLLIRRVGLVDFIFSVGADELSTYMDATASGTSIIRERPDYTNITNGIGIFSSRFITIRSLELSEKTLIQMDTDPLTKDLNFYK